MKKLNYIGLNQNQWNMVDEALSASNEKNYDCGRTAYCCGFKDAMNLLKESAN